MPRSQPQSESLIPLSLFAPIAIAIFISTAGAVPGAARAGERPPGGTAEASELEAAAKFPLPAISERALRAHVAFLAHRELEGRLAGSRFERIAAAHVAAHLDAAGIPPPPGKDRIQAVPLPPAGSQPPAESLNVLGFIEGSDPALRDEVLVIGAHIDHLGTRGSIWFPGAEDNASGVAVAIELAAAFAEGKDLLGRSILLAFFGAEEQGRLGSEHFVAQPPVPRDRIAAMINIDMIGRPVVDQKALAPLKALVRFDDRKSVGVVGALDRPTFAAAVEAGCARAGVTPFGTKRVAFVSDLVEKLARDRADNAPFEAAGIPALFFGSGESDDYHRPTDTADKVDPRLMVSRARAIFATAVILSKTPRDRLPRVAPAAELVPEAKEARAE